jgi:hypothetical protein
MAAYQLTLTHLPLLTFLHGPNRYKASEGLISRHTGDNCSEGGEVPQGESPAAAPAPAPLAAEAAAAAAAAAFDAAAAAAAAPAVPVPNKHPILMTVARFYQWLTDLIMKDFGVCAKGLRHGRERQDCGSSNDLKKLSAIRAIRKGLEARRMRQLEGIAKAKADKKYKGRKSRITPELKKKMKDLLNGRNYKKQDLAGA